MLEELKQKVFEANLLLPKHNLVVLTWGNVSEIDRKSNLVVIKPSGVPYEKLRPEMMVVVNEKGEVVEGDLKPSVDTPTHLELYRQFKDIGGIAHTHSTWATIWAQAGRSIPCLGGTHADHFISGIPCTRALTKEEAENEMELNTGKVIVETFKNLDYHEIPAVLEAFHGPFTWGRDALEAAQNSIVLEEVAKMSYFTLELNPHVSMPEEIIAVRYSRKHGAKAYYGQNITL